MRLSNAEIRLIALSKSLHQLCNRDPGPTPAELGKFMLDNGLIKRCHPGVLSFLAGDVPVVLPKPRVRKTPSKKGRGR